MLLELLYSQKNRLGTEESNKYLIEELFDAMDISCNGNDKKVGVIILTSDKVDFKTKAIKKDKEGHDLMIKGSIQQDTITRINIFAPNIGAPRYIKQILMGIKGEVDGNTIIVGKVNTPTHINRQIF